MRKEYSQQYSQFIQIYNVKNRNYLAVNEQDLEVGISRSVVHRNGKKIVGANGLDLSEFIVLLKFYIEVRSQRNYLIRKILGKIVVQPSNVC